LSACFIGTLRTFWGFLEVRRDEMEAI
jgi:hypothetical protein